MSNKEDFSIVNKTNYHEMYAVNKPPLPITVNIVSAYHSIKNTKHKDTNYSNKQKMFSDDDFVGFVHCIDKQGVIETTNGDLLLKKNDFCFIKINEVKSFNFIVEKWKFFCV